MYEDRSPEVAAGPPSHTEFLKDERYVDAGGYRVRASVEGTGPPLLLINGIAANIELWHPLRQLLPARRTIAFDAPGVGGSPLPRNHLRLPDLADIVDALLGELEFEELDVLGYSFGGALAQQLVRQHPSRVRRLILAATIPGVGAIQNPFLLMRLTQLAMRVPSPARTLAVARAMGGKVAVDGEVRALIELMHRSRPTEQAGVVQQLMAMAGWTSVPWLHLIRTQTLVLAAEADPLVPLLNGRIFTSCIPGCSWHCVPNAGHLFLFDQPEEAAGVIDKFLDTPEATSISG
jgi:pimeloyl-ACP methyl ester carboxylesterase